MAHVHGSKIGTSFSVPKVNPATQNLRHNQWPHAKGYLDRSDALQCCDQRAKCEVELRHASWTASKHSEGQLWNAMDSFSKSRNRKSKRRHWTLAENWTWFSLFSLIFYCHYCLAVFVAIAVAVATAVAAAAAESKWCWLQLHCVFCNRCTIGWISPGVTAPLFFLLSFANSPCFTQCLFALMLWCSFPVVVCNAPCPNRHLPNYQRKQKQENQDFLAIIKSKQRQQKVRTQLWTFVYTLLDVSHSWGTRLCVCMHDFDRLFAFSRILTLCLVSMGPRRVAFVVLHTLDTGH